MKILVIGSGGREHAIAWKLAKSNKVEAVFVAPGNSGTSLEPKVHNLPFSEIVELINFAKQNHINFTVVGPEAPLANGIVNEFRRHNLKIWGPTQYAAQLESSKDFAKNFMVKYGIPTAKYKTFSDQEQAINYLAAQTLPIVLKADGLAAGKGVLVATTYNEATTFLNEIFSHNKFGNAGNKVVIEEFVEGIEASFIVMIDGENILPLATSQDHKRLLDNDQGPNTGGMGAYSPAPIIDHELHNRIINQAIYPVISGMKNEGYSYTGFLYAGLMIDKNKDFKVLEYNCRLGDPETQPIMLRLKTDLVDLIEAGLTQKLDHIEAQWENQLALGIVLASYGYPDQYRKGDIISGLNDIASDIKVFHAGTKLEGQHLYTNGGRVLCVVGMAEDIITAQLKVYEAVRHISFSGMQYRHDIGSKCLYE